MKSARALLVSLGLVAVAMSAPVSNAHVEEGCGLEVILVVAFLQGECFVNGDASCDPDYDAEHTRPDAGWLYLGGSAGFLPHSGCGLEFQDVHFPSATRAVAVLGKISGLMTLAKYEVRLLVDDVVVQKATFLNVPCECPGVYPFDLGLGAPLPLTLELLEPTIAAGTHDLRVEYSVLQGPAYMNLFVDAVVFLDPTVCGVLNGPPEVPGILATDGLLGLPLGWAGQAFPYTFEAVAADGASVAWRTADGLVDGATLQRAFGTVGWQGLEVLATGAPLLEACPGGPPLPQGLPKVQSVGRAAFQTLPGLDVALVDLDAQTSCIGDRRYELPPPAMPVIAFDCVLRASLDDHVEDTVLANEVVYTLDQRPFSTAVDGGLFESVFDSLEHAAGVHELRAEAQVEGDKFDRVFSSPPHRFVNAGLV